MSKSFKVPELGEGVESGDVIKVLVEVGDKITEGTGVIEIESQKASAEVPFDDKGTVRKVHVSEGDTVRPGDVILTYDSPEEAESEEKDKEKGEPQEPERSHPREGERAKEEAEVEEREAKKPSPEAQERALSERARTEEEERPEEEEPSLAEEEGGPPSAADLGFVMATPSVRRLAREIGVNVHGVEGSGPGGRVLEEDVKAAARRLVQSGGTQVRGPVSRIRGEAPDYDDFGPVRRDKMNAVRRTTALHMAGIWTAVPRVTNFGKADFTAIQDARARLADGGDKISLSAILVRLVAVVLHGHSRLNASVDMDREQVVLHDYVHVGVAVDTPRGLLVPVVRDADRKDVRTVHRELAALADKARASKLGAEAMRGATFTLSNLGGLGGGWFTPIVNAPEAAILGVGRARMEPVWIDGSFQPRPMCPLSLSYDHRLVDGADAARFLLGLVDAMENPLVAVLQGEPT